MYRYEMYEENMESEELGVYVTYGIKAFGASGEMLCAVSDVSTDRALVQTLCESCTAEQLYPIHLRDVIEDSIV